jgi:Transposase and inactivated derivatives
LTRRPFAKPKLGDRGAEVLLEKVMNEILQAEMTEHLGAEPGEQTNQRQGYRNGSYERQLTTRIGQLKLEVPRDQEGTFRTELFERYQRSETALVTALMQMVIQGVSTRRVKKITTELCGREFSRWALSNLTERPRASKLRPGPSAHSGRIRSFWPCDADANTSPKVRRQGAVRSTTAMIVVGISEEGYREILGFKTHLRETRESWKELFEDLKERGLRDVEFATSDAHEGLEKALRACFPGCIWNRCHTEESLGVYFQRNVLGRDRPPIATTR